MGRIETFTAKIVLTSVQSKNILILLNTLGYSEYVGSKAQVNNYLHFYIKNFIITTRSPFLKRKSLNIMKNSSKLTRVKKLIIEIFS